MTTTSDELLLTLGGAVQRLDTISGAAPARADRHVAALGALWTRTLDGVISRWQAEVSPLQRQHLERSIGDAVQAQDVGALAALTLPVLAEAENLIYDAMRVMAGAGAAAVADEARAAGLELGMAPPMAAVTLLDWARAAADLLTVGLALGAAREALRLYRPGRTAAAVLDGVRGYLDGLTDRPLRDIIGGALTRAQNLGRLQAYAGPRPADWTVRLIADETLDERTCAPCRKIDGTELPSPDAAALAYGGAGYLFCQGGERCRGTMRGIWERRERPVSDVLWPLGEILDRVYKRDRKGRFSETEERALAATVKAAKALPEDSEHWHRLTGGASGSGVRLATLPDGRRVVHKRAPDWGSDEPRTQADAEELASLVGDVLDAPVALVQRDGDSVWVQHAAGKTLGAAEDGDADALTRFEAFRASSAGIHMGLLDVLIGNNDRNDGNLILGDDEVIGIDHAFAFEMIGYQHGAPHPDDLGRMGGEHAPAGHFITRDDNGRNHWAKDNPMTPGDVIETRRRLEALRSAFDRAERRRWLDNALLMLDQLGKHAGGSESIYA
jgi:hypothetical protein